MTAQIGLGLAALGRPGYINLGHAEDLNQNYSLTAMRNRAHDVLDAAWDSGVRYYDAARSYGRAEEFLGDWIRDRNIPTSEISVGSKWGYTYTAAWKTQTAEGVSHEVKRHELAVLKSQYMASFKCLGTHLGLYQIHSATLDSGVLSNQEILGVLNQLRDTGMKVGLSVSGPNQSATIEQALAIEFDSVPLFSSIQATWNLLETSTAAALAAAAAKGCQIIVKESLANGRLTLKNDSADFAKTRSQLERIAAANQTTIDALSIAAAMNQPWATTVLSGAATVEHLASNLTAQNVAWNSELANELDGFFESPESYWKTRSELEWN